ncbi:MAG: redoxin domain-containing protein [Chloroflexota bacterium]
MSITVATGDELPSVGLRASDGYLLNLRSFVTKQPALLLFFGAPTLKGAAAEPGLAAIRALSAAHGRLHEAGIGVAAISTDSEKEQVEFAAQLNLPYLLLSDERRSAVELLGIPTATQGDNVNVARPVAIVVDREGIVRAVIDDVEPHYFIEHAMSVLSEPMPATAGDAAAAS